MFAWVWRGVRRVSKNYGRYVRVGDTVDGVIASLLQFSNVGACDTISLEDVSGSLDESRRTYFDSGDGRGLGRSLFFILDSNVGSILRVVQVNDVFFGHFIL